TVDFVDRQPHRYAHEKYLRQFDTAILDVQEVSVIQGLQAKVAELQVAIDIQCSCQLGMIELRQTGIQQSGIDAELDVFGEVFDMRSGQIVLGYWGTKHFTADLVQQQAGSNVVVSRFALDQAARRKDQRAPDFLGRNPVIQVPNRLFHHPCRRN